MRGGTYRFQAQYVRKIRVPAPSDISAGDARRLRGAFRKRDAAAATTVATTTVAATTVAATTVAASTVASAVVAFAAL